MACARPQLADPGQQGTERAVGGKPIDDIEHADMLANMARDGQSHGSGRRADRLKEWDPFSVW